MAATPNEPVTYHISPWPILGLNVLALAAIFLFCWLFAQVNHHTPNPGDELGEVEAMIFWYFLGVGGVISVAASYLGWIGGPEVTLSPEGLSMQTSWLLDKGFPTRRQFVLNWAHVARVETASFLLMRYLKITSLQPGAAPFYLPLFITDRNGFRRNLMALAPEENPVRRWFVENV